MKKSLLTVSKEQLLAYALQFYKLQMGYSFDINNPKKFTEKIQWYTFYYNNPLCPYIVDKVTFKDYIKEKLGPGFTIAMYGSWDNVEALEENWNSLPNEFCLKANLQSDGKNIKIIHNKTDIIFDELKSEMIDWLKPENTQMNSLARPFYMSKPQILAEQFIANFAEQLYDYKFFCFNGQPYCIYVAMDHFGKDGSHISFYDLNWEQLDVSYGNHLKCNAPRPKHLNEMLEMAKSLSAGFPFVRVDFFDTDDQPYVAELTFNPGGGFTHYYPESFNDTLGDLFVLPQ